MGDPMKTINSENVTNPAFPTHFDSFEKFYPFYLSEHRNRMCKLMHFIGMCCAQATLVGIVLTGRWQQIWILPIFGYGFAWVGHFVFEKNKPASFKFPAYSFRGDFHLWYDLLTGRLGFETNAERVKD
jgi:hypothetical protein